MSRLPPVPGSRIEVYWPLDRQFYAGTVIPNCDRMKTRISYDDGQEEVLDLNDGGRERWRP